jgi:hypothetical protein
VTIKQWTILALLAVGVLLVFALVVVVALPSAPGGPAPSGASIQSDLERAGFRFEANASSESRKIGENKERSQVVELVGSPNQWTSLTVASTLSSDAGKRASQVQSMQLLLRQAIPDWDASEWLATNVPVVVEKGSVETTRGNARITLKTIRPPGVTTLFLIVQPR